MRAQSLLRRSKALTSEVVTNGPLRVDMRQHKAFVFGVPVVLSSIERRFLEVLVQNLGEPVTYRELLNSVWETQDESGGKDMIKMTAYRLRGSLGPEGAALVQSVRSVGYMMPEL